MKYKFRFSEFLIAGLFLIICVMMLRWKSVESQAKNEDAPFVYLPQVVKPTKMKAEYTFAGEKVPLNLDTKERLEREMLVNAYLHASTLWALKMHTRYFPQIEATLKEQGIPDDFKYLAVAESNLMNATSPVGAKGVWQFMPATAREMGMTLNGEVDERLHIVESTRAACRYLKQLYATTGSWVNAAAAYNVGPGRIKSTMTVQGESSYFDMSLNEETSRYLFRILAIKEIIKDPTSFGFMLETDDYYQPHANLQKVNVSASQSLSTLAKDNGLSFKMLKYYNPWLIGDKLTITNKNYAILVPKK